MKKLICFGWLLISMAWATTPDWPREVNGQACGHSREELVKKFKATGLTTMSVAYYDTGDLQLQGLSLTVRLRVKDDQGELTVKLRAESLSGIPAGGECEVDVYRGRSLSACSWEEEIDRDVAIKAMDGRIPLRQLMNQEQLDLLNSRAPNVRAPWRRFGPVNVERWDITKGESGKKWRLERWVLPNQQALLSEVSFSEKKPQSIDELRGILDAHFSSMQVRRCDKDEPKTSIVLRHFQELM